jgi:hypothetical protein
LGVIWGREEIRERHHAFWSRLYMRHPFTMWLF